MCQTLQTLRILFNTPAQWTGTQSLSAVGCGSRRPLSNGAVLPGRPRVPGTYEAYPDLQCSLFSDIQHSHLIQHLQPRSLHLQTKTTRCDATRQQLECLFCFRKQLVRKKISSMVYHVYESGI